MHTGMAGNAKGDKVVLYIIATAAAELLMMYFEIEHRAASLAPPPVTSEHLIQKLRV